MSHGDGADGHIHDAYHSHHSHSHDHKHDDSVTSVSITIEEDLNLEMVGCPNLFRGGRHIITDSVRAE